MRSQSDYEKSNSIDDIEELGFLPVELKESIVNGKSTDARSRSKLGQEVIDCICKRLSIPTVKLQVKGSPQKHYDKNGKLKSKTLGLYKHFAGHGMDIVIWNLTAKRHQVVASKTFWQTLIHEVCHHVDCAFLKIYSSPHTSGFYKRISSIDRRFK